MDAKICCTSLERSLLGLGICVLLFVAPRIRADEPVSFQKLGAEFSSEIRPILNESCMKCHSTDEQKGTLDLEQFEKIDDVRRSTKTWLKVAEMLDNGEMPPKDAPQPKAPRRQRLRGWVADYLRAEALARAGDPGPVVLRRLSNAEYTYTLLDLTGVDLQPAREFPADGAAGEGFTNTGNALVMSPALLSKYFDAGKKIASHAVLLPESIRFSAGATRRDWTNEILGRIRSFYARFTDTGGGTQVNLQGIIFGTNDGGRLPLEKYLRATIRHREALGSGAKNFAEVATQENLNAKYLEILWQALHGPERTADHRAISGSLVGERRAGRAALAREIAQWQKALWRFTSVGQFGKIGGPKAWMEPVTPIAAAQELRLKMPEISSGEVTLYFVAGDAGDGSEHDLVVWERPRLVAPGRSDLLLRDVRAVAGELAALREQAFGAAANCLAAAAEASAAESGLKVEELAKRHGVEPRVLSAWLDYLGIGTSGARVVKIDTLLKSRIENSSGYDFVKGWGSPDLPIVVANSSDQHVRIPGNMNPHSVAMHPTPTLRVAAGWTSPSAAVLQIEGRVQHAHPECGNGVTWSLELRRGSVRQKLASGIAARLDGRDGWSGQERIGAAGRPGLALDRPARWQSRLRPDVSRADSRRRRPPVEPGQRGLAGHSRRQPARRCARQPGRLAFSTASPTKEGATPSFPPARCWHNGNRPPAQPTETGWAWPFRICWRRALRRPKTARTGCSIDQLASLRGPLASAFRLNAAASSGRGALAANPGGPAIGPDPALFGKQPGGPAIDPASIAVRAPRSARDPAARRPCRGLRIRDPRHARADGGCRRQRATSVACEQARSLIPGGTGRSTGSRARSLGIAAPVRVGLRAVAAGFPARPVLHQDRAGGRSDHPDAVLSRGWPPAAADARRCPG